MCLCFRVCKTTSITTGRDEIRNEDGFLGQLGFFPLLPSNIRAYLVVWEVFVFLRTSNDDAIKKKNQVSISSMLSGFCIISLLGLFKGSFRFCFRYWYPIHGCVKTVGVSILMLAVEFCWFLAASVSQKKKTSRICEIQGEIKGVFGKAYRIFLYCSCQMLLRPWSNFLCFGTLKNWGSLYCSAREQTR